MKILLTACLLLALCQSTNSEQSMLRGRDLNFSKKSVNTNPYQEARLEEDEDELTEAYDKSQVNKEEENDPYKVYEEELEEEREEYYEYLAEEGFTIDEGEKVQEKLDFEPSDEDDEDDAEDHAEYNDEDDEDDDVNEVDEYVDEDEDEDDDLDEDKDEDEDDDDDEDEYYPAQDKVYKYDNVISSTTKSTLTKHSTNISEGHSTYDHGPNKQHETLSKTKVTGDSKSTGVTSANETKQASTTDMIGTKYCGVKLFDGSIQCKHPHPISCFTNEDCKVLVEIEGEMVSSIFQECLSECAAGVNNGQAIVPENALKANNDEKVADENVIVMENGEEYYSILEIDNSLIVVEESQNATENSFTVKKYDLEHSDTSPQKKYCGIRDTDGTETCNPKAVSCESNADCKNADKDEIFTDCLSSCSDSVDMPDSISSSNQAKSHTNSGSDEAFNTSMSNTDSKVSGDPTTLAEYVEFVDELVAVEEEEEESEEYHANPTKASSAAHSHTNSGMSEASITSKSKTNEKESQNSTTLAEYVDFVDELVAAEEQEEESKEFHVNPTKASSATKSHTNSVKNKASVTSKSKTNEKESQNSTTLAEYVDFVDELVAAEEQEEESEESHANPTKASSAGHNEITASHSSTTNNHEVSSEISNKTFVDGELEESVFEKLESVGKYCGVKDDIDGLHCRNPFLSCKSDADCENGPDDEFGDIYVTCLMECGEVKALCDPVDSFIGIPTEDASTAEYYYYENSEGSEEGESGEGDEYEE